MANLSMLTDPPMRPVDYAERFHDKAGDCVARGDVAGAALYNRLLDACLKLEHTLWLQREKRRVETTETCVCSSCGGSR